MTAAHLELLAPPLECPASLEDFAAFRARTLAALEDLLGSCPFRGESPPLAPRTLYTTDDGAFWRHKVRYGSADTDDVVWAWLLVPKDIENPVPAVICLPGTFMTPNWGKDGPVGLAGPENRGDPEAYGADLARLGYVTLCPDYPCAGERTSPGLKSHDTAVFDRRFPEWTRVGMSAWDVSRAVDFLLTVPEVDSARIGCTGWSQGGQMSLLGAALEPRIAAVASVCGWTPWRGMPPRLVENLVQSYNYPHLRHCAEQGIRLDFDLEHVAALIAPRPFLDLRADGDRVHPNVDAMQQAAAELHKVYALYGVPEHFSCRWFGGAHRHGSEAARETQAWLYRWLWREELLADATAGR